MKRRTPRTASRPRLAHALVPALVAMWPRPAAAYRPFDSTDAAVARRGEFELELGPGYLVEAGSRAIVAPRTVLNVGVTSRIELVLEGIGLIPLDASTGGHAYRIDDTALSLKAILREGGLQETSGPSVATEAGVLLPTLNGEPGTGASLAMIVSQQWAALTVHLNAQAFRTRAKNLGLFGGLILEGPERWLVRPVGEVFVADERGFASTTSGLAGAIWRAGETLSVDAAVRAARRGDVREYEVRVGFTWDLRLWGEP